MLQLQAAAGNAAVSALVSRSRTAERVLQRREAGAPVPPPPVAPTPPVPEEHPGFQEVSKRIATTAKTAASHPTAKTPAAAAQQAAKPPADAKEGIAKADKAEKMAASKPGTFDKAAFVAAVNQAVAEKAPKNLDEADKFATSGKSDAIASTVMGKVSKGKEDSAKPMADASNATPDTSKAAEKAVKPLSPAAPAAAPPVGAAAAMPTKAPAEQTNLEHGPAETENQLAAADVTQEQLAKSNEPEFTGALEAKKEGEAHSQQAPAAFRESEAAKLQAAQTSAQAAGAQGVATMVGAKAQSQQKVVATQAKTQSADEAKRAEVTTHIKGIFDKTKGDVDAILADLDGLVAKKFDEGEKKAKAAFTADHQTRMEKYKDDRYSGLLGAGRWLKDKWSGLPEEANNIYQVSKKIYEDQMQVLIGDIADTIGAKLTEAKNRVAAGKAEIDTYVKGLPKDLQKVGGQAASEIGSQFDELDASIDDKSQSLAEDLAGKYVESRNAVDDEIKAMQEENKGLWDKVKDAVGGAIQTILKLKDMLFGVLARAAGAVTKIIKDPIGFLGNFINAVKTGVTNFLGNIWTHLKKGLQGWLFGTLAEAGIEIPEKFDLKGIVTLVLSLLGLTWNSLRARIVKHVGEPVMGLIEKGVDFIKIVLTEGVGGLWKWIVAKLSDLYDMVMGQIKDFVVTKIITAGITWLISLLNPAAAFIKACKLIYDAVMWFVDNAERLKDFVDSILDSVESIASGGVGAVAGYIENTLSKMVPMLISGLASLLGLGGIADKVKGVLEKVQSPVGKVVDSLVGSAVKFGKNALTKMSKMRMGKAALALKDKGKAAIAAGKAYVKGKVEAGKAYVAGKVEAVKAAFSIRKSFTVDGEEHSLYTTGAGPGLMVASTNPTGLDNHPDPAVKNAYASYLAAFSAAKTDAAKKAATAKPLVVVLAALKKWLAKGKKDPQASAPGIGNIALYRNQPSSLREGAPAVWALEAEHVVPRGFSNAIFTMLRLEGIPSGGTDYRGQTTIMIYKGAATIKTHGPDADNAMTRELKTNLADIFAEYRRAKPSAKPAIAKVVYDTLGNLLAGYASDATARTEVAVEQENKQLGARRGPPGKPESATPTAGRVQQAALLQIQDVMRQLRSRIG